MWKALILLHRVGQTVHCTAPEGASTQSRMHSLHNYYMEALLWDKMMNKNPELRGRIGQMPKMTLFSL